MTPAVDQLKQENIVFTLHQYQHDTNASSFGLEAAEKLNIATEQVFKTLVVCDDKQQLAVAIVPVDHQLNLKAMAKALKVKKIKMAEAKKVETSSGYVLGGVSPLGQKRKLPTVIDQSSQNFTTIFVSGGKRGLEIELSADDLAKSINGRFFCLT
jgi:Cys-tRNA(Pro)/Cys-tRNA(Cys) deacylase